MRASRFGGIGMIVSAEALQSFHALLFGFALAGLLASGYQLVTRQPASFSLLEHGPSPSTFAAIPFLVFAAPFIIVSVTLRAPRERSRFITAMLAAIVAGFWSLMSGTVVVMALEALRF
jgi:hypothetical protein